MTISSRFYTGFVNNIEWADGTSRLGYRYSVADLDDFRVEIDDGAVRGVRVLPGTAFGGGVETTSDDNELRTLSNPASGSRWDLVGIRRVWGATNASSVDVIEGGSTKQIPTRPTNRGVEDFQPLALVQVTDGEPLPNEVVDLRAIGNNTGPLIAFDDLVRTYLTAIGTQLRIGLVEWNRYVNSIGSPDWDSRDLSRTVLTGSAATQEETEFWSRQAACRLVRDGDTRQAVLVAKRTGSNVTAGSTGLFSVGPIRVMKLAPSDRPAMTIPVAAYVRSNTGGNLYAAGAYIDTDGWLMLSSTGPGVGIGDVSGQTDTISAIASWRVES